MITTMRRRIFISMFICMFVTGLLFYFVLSSWLPRQNTALAEDRLKKSLNLAAQIVSLSPGGNWQGIVDRLAEASGYRVTIISAGGHVMADSTLKLDDFAFAEDHGQRSEIAEALRIGFGFSLRHSSSLTSHFIYAARAVPEHNIVLRLADPVKQVIYPPWPWLLLAGLMGVALILIASHLLANRYARPIQEISACLPNLEDSCLGYPWRALNCDPWIKQMAHSLETMGKNFQQRLEQLNQDAMRLKSLLQSLGKPVLTINRQGRITLCNQAASDLFGKDLIGKNQATVLRNADLLAAVDQAAGGRQAVIDEVRLADGQIWDAVCSPILDAGNQPEVVVVMHNLTQLKKMASMRRDFIANFSHELRTPLAVIKSAQETLSGLMGGNKDSIRFLESIARQVERLQRLLEDLLALAHLESPEWHCTAHRPISARQLMDETRLAMEEKAEPANVKLQVEPMNDDLSFMGEYNTIERALINLLDNAIKYSPPGEQVVMRSYAADNRLIIEVEDNGPGVAPEHQARIFERFYRADKSRSAPEGSTGLGLAIVRHAALLHGGEAGHKNQNESGSIFFIALPLL